MIGNIIDYIRAEPIIIQIVIGALAIFVLSFFCFFFIQAAFLWVKLGKIVAGLRNIEKTENRDLTPLFPRDTIYAHLWTEYHDTLHEQHEFDAALGEKRLVALRSTIPAAMVFTTEALVDSQLRTEFFKHLPGLFTGTGIIGTFLGLIQGLTGFKVSDDSKVVRAGLEGLLQSVSNAFIISAIAISFAMVVTLFEKLWVTALYRKVEEITIELDRMFQSGAGEEYLARLVKASEDSAAQSGMLKDALVKDLDVILSKLTDRQIQAQAQGSQDLARQFTESMTAGLKAPLEQIAETFKKATTDNSGAVTELLTDVLAGFSEKLEGLFGGQISGINQLQQQTIQALQAAVTKLGEMASTVEAAGQKTTDSMGKKLIDAIGEMESRQQRMNETMTAFVEQIRNLVRDSEGESNKKLQETLQEIGDAVRLQISALEKQGKTTAESHLERETLLADQTRKMLEALQGQADRSEETQRDREQRMAKQADETVAKLASLTEGLMGEVRVITHEVRNMVDAMRNVTSDAVSRMNSGAETLYLASDEFSKAGKGVAGVLQQATSVANKLADVAESVSVSSGTFQSVVADYATTRATLATMLTDLRSTVENAKREANLTAEILTRIEAASQKLGKAQKDAEDYLAGISETLASAHEAFTVGLKKALGDGHKEFHERLSHATGLLREAIEELATSLEPPMKRRG